MKNSNVTNINETNINEEKKMKVSIDEVKTYVNETNKISAKNLLKRMEEFETKYIPTHEFEKVKETIECAGCGKALGREAKEGQDCMDCQKQIKRAEAERKRNGEWDNLLEQLKKLDRGFEIIENRYNDKRIRLTRHKHLYAEIFITHMDNGSSFRLGQAVLRIETNDYDVKYNRGKWWFNTDDITTKLNKKCNDLMNKIEEKKSQRKQKENAKNELKANTEMALVGKIEGEASQCYRSGRHGRYEESKSVECKLKGGYKVTTWNAETFSLTLPRTFNVEEIEQIMNLVDSMKKVS